MCSLRLPPVCAKPAAPGQVPAPLGFRDAQGRKFPGGACGRAGGHCGIRRRVLTPFKGGYGGGGGKGSLLRMYTRNLLAGTSFLVSELMEKKSILCYIVLGVLILCSLAGIKQTQMLPKCLSWEIKILFPNFFDVVDGLSEPCGRQPGIPSHPLQSAISPSLPSNLQSLSPGQPCRRSAPSPSSPWPPPQPPRPRRRPRPRPSAVAEAPSFRPGLPRSSPSLLPWASSGGGGGGGAGMTMGMAMAMEMAMEMAMITDMGMTMGGRRTAGARRRSTRTPTA